MAAAALEPIAVPGGEGGVGFDDLVYSRALGRLLVPAGRTGQLDLVDAHGGAPLTVGGFSVGPRRAPGHGQGTTSADAGGGYAFASDRTRRTLAVIDLAARRILATEPLAGGPDYVRWVEAAGQIWVTEPDREWIEVFRLVPGSPPRLARVGTIAVPDGPESLVIDPTGRRAYTNTFGDTTVAIDVASRAVTARWKNGCRAARGIAVDAAGAVVFAGCAEGEVVALDTRTGAPLGAARTDTGVDGIAYAPALSHVYAPAAERGTVAVVGVTAGAKLTLLGALPAAKGAHCAAADDEGDAFVCDPDRGRVLVLRDPYPASR